MSMSSTLEQLREEKTEVPQKKQRLTKLSVSPVKVEAGSLTGFGGSRMMEQCSVCPVQCPRD